MSPEGKVQVVVKSRRIPLRTVEVSEPIFSPSGVFMGTRSNRVILYGSVLDEGHRRAIEEGQRLSCDLGLELEVVDASKKGLFGRVRSSLGLGGAGGPTLVVSPLSTECEGPVSQDATTSL